MKMLLAIKGGISRTMGNATLKFKGISPTVFTGMGIAFGVGCVVVACVQTTKLDKPLDEAKETIDRIHKAREEKPEEYTEKMERSDLTKVYARTGVDIVRLYALPAALGAVSTAFIIPGHNALRRENAALTAAYIALDKSYKEYRNRVRNDIGADKDRQYYYGERKADIVHVDPETNEVTVEENTIQEGHHISPYARFFDRGNDNWCKNPEFSYRFLVSVQNQCNDKLNANGHLFLNEVYDALGFNRSEAGQYVGWVVGFGDGKVDFGLKDVNYPPTRRFINGDEDAILLDFNVDGPIMHIFEGLKPERMKG